MSASLRRAKAFLTFVPRLESYGKVSAGELHRPSLTLSEKLTSCSKDFASGR
jgi:hypothetical protein